MDNDNQLLPASWGEEITSSRANVPSGNSLRGAQGLGPNDSVGYSLMFWNVEDLACTCAVLGGPLINTFASGHRCSLLRP